MANYRTYEGYVGWIEDNVAYGTWQAPDKYMYFPVQPIPQTTRGVIDAASVRGLEGKHISDIEPGYEYVTLTLKGTLPIITSSPAFLFLLKHILPNITRTPAGAAMTHVFLPYETDYTLGLSFAVAFGAIERYKISGARPTRLKLSSKVGEAILWEMDFLGRFVARDQTMDVPAVTLKATHPIWFNSPGNTVTFEVPTGSALSNFHEWEMVYTIDRDPGEAISGQLGTGYPVQLPRLGASLAVKITRRADFTDGAGGIQSKFNDISMWAAGGADPDIQMKIAYADGTIPTTAVNYTLQLEANVAIPPDKRGSNKVDSSGKILMESIELDGFMDGTNELLKLTTISEAATPVTGTPP